MLPIFEEARMKVIFCLFSTMEIERQIVADEAK
jgi:hypothetical protein